MKRVLVTGAAGNIGTYLRSLLPAVYPDIVWSDIRTPSNLSPTEKFVAADLADMAACEQICKGIEGIVHLGGISGEAPWENILNANISGCYNIFEAARRQGVKRLIMATSNHAVGFYPRETIISPDVIARPDSRYGLSKLFGEGLGALYAYKHGMGVLALRIGNVNEKPIDMRRMSIWIHPEDLVQLIRVGLERPGLVFEVCYGTSDNKRGWYDNQRAFELGYRPKHKSEHYLSEAEAAQVALDADPVGDFYQGGTFCSAEYTADFTTMKQKS